MAKNAAKLKGKSGDEPGFEESMARLEEIVEAMQSEDLPLDQVIERYEEGMKLIAVCARHLKAAEEKIELLTREKSGIFREAELASGPEEEVSSREEDEPNLF